MANRRCRGAASSRDEDETELPDPNNLKIEIKEEVLDPELDPESILFNPLKAIYAEKFNEPESEPHFLPVHSHSHSVDSTGAGSKSKSRSVEPPHQSRPQSQQSGTVGRLELKSEQQHCESSYKYGYSTSSIGSTPSTSRSISVDAPTVKINVPKKYYDESDGRKKNDESSSSSIRSRRPSQNSNSSSRRKVPQNQDSACTKTEIKEETSLSLAVSVSSCGSRSRTDKDFTRVRDVTKDLDRNRITQLKSYPDNKPRQRSSSFSHSDFVTTSESSKVKSTTLGSNKDLFGLPKPDNSRLSRCDTSKAFDNTRLNRPHYDHSSRSASVSLRGACSSNKSKTGEELKSYDPQSLATRVSKAKIPPVVKTEIQESSIHRQLKDRQDGQISESHPSKQIKAKKNLLNQMSGFVGPMSVLKRAVEEKLQVRIMTRQAVNTRAICKGYIVAFDKYMNMAMIDVDEIYRRPKILGKVKSKRSHKLKAAQTSLLFEKEELNTHRERITDSTDQKVLEQPGTSNNNNNELNRMASLENVKIASLKQIMNTATSIIDPAIKASPSSLDISVNRANDIKTTPSSMDISVKRANEIKTTPSSINVNVGKMTQIKASPSSVDICKKKQQGISLERKLRKMKSIYPELPAALSPFEREALMLGIPDENVEIRHMNQVFIRGENIVSVNIVEDF